MTSAIWKEIDPEIMDAATRKKFPDAVGALGFSWADRKKIPAPDVTPFLTPDLRTEYIPMHSIQSPDQKWTKTKKPILNAQDFSQMWDPQTLEKSLEAIPEEYSNWINDLETAKDGTNDDIIDKIMSDCNESRKRIETGIKLLVNDDDARLAFCFANKAINLQNQWKKRIDLEYRPFQIAFILMTIESILHGNSQDRNICDLLWVPTGGGKTEAYLVLVAIDMAYRRLKAIRNGQSGSGVSVFTRYTLRLLSIQQFRRTLQIFTAAELLRVENVSNSKPVGWRPDSCTEIKDVLWGSTPFSVGLWVGGTLTPNYLAGYWDNIARTQKGAALEILKINPTEANKRNMLGEPAQILECPSCSNILSIPRSGLEKNIPYTLNLIIRSDSSAKLLNDAMKNFTHEHISFDKKEFSEINPGYFVFEIIFTNTRITDWDEMCGPSGLWTKIESELISQKLVSEGCLQSTSAVNPGYFFKTFVKNRTNRLEPYDFEIFCTSSTCPLKKEWFAGSPMGGVNGNVIDISSMTDISNDIKLNDGNKLVQIQKCFMNDDYVSDRVPIPALTVDEQVYKNLPTMIVATVDKFARLPFEPKASGLFGNVKHYDILSGYYRIIKVNDNGTDQHARKDGKADEHRELKQIEIPHPPNFIIQDELHLLEGPLGSMVGLYESCVDFLSQTKHKIKYIASTATIKRGSDQVKSIFSRELQIFPPNGVDIDDRFFITTKKSEDHALYDNEAGRLYLGVMAPSKGALTPVIRIWSNLAQTAKDNENDPEIDRFWTLVGYFNAVRELGGATALYRQDIPQRIQLISRERGRNRRDLDDRLKEELSGRTNSDELPSILDKVGNRFSIHSPHNAVDALFTTSMFGTGVDVPRLGLMLVNGQPKTTSAYIQSTGRVGREKGGLVVVFFRATRPRDLSHYEYFINHHIQLARNVESPTVYPFSPGALNQALGPILVAMLRNMRNPLTEWQKENSAISMKTHYQNPEITEIAKFVETRAQHQPPHQIPKPEDILKAILEKRDVWYQLALDQTTNILEYSKHDQKDVSMVLGDLLHQSKGAMGGVAFPNTPTSLRTLEGETGFGI